MILSDQELESPVRAVKVLFRQSLVSALEVDDLAKINQMTKTKMTKIKKS